MKKKQLVIEENENPLGSYEIIVNNARYQKDFSVRMEKILRVFLDKEELFFGFYRIDGINLTAKRQKELKYEIPAFFQKYGEMQVLSEYLSVARIRANEQIYRFIPSIFDYYLDTVLFNPRAEWEVFRQYYFNYQKHRFHEMILNDFTELLFYYSDSGDFSICFDSKKYSTKKVRKEIGQIFESDFYENRG